MASFPQASPPTPCAPLYPPPYAPHAQPISFVSILPSAPYWVRSTDHSAPRYAALCLHKIGAGGMSCGELLLEATCNSLTHAEHPSFLFMLLVGVCDLLHSVSFCCSCYMGHRRTESEISKLCSCDPNVTSSFCFKAFVMDVLSDRTTAPISVRRFGMYRCAVNSSHFPKSQNSTCVWTLHPFPTCVARLRKNCWHLPVRNNLPSYLYTVTQKKGTFEKHNKNWRNPRRKIYWQKLNHYNLPFKRQ